MSEGSRPGGRTGNTVKGNRKGTTGNSLANALDFQTENYLAEKVETASLGIVGGASGGGKDAPGGTVTATPAVNRTNTYGEAVPGVPLNAVPAMRLQAGRVAIVIPAQPGDKGLVVFTKQDSSAVGPGTGEPVQPASYRTFDQANGFFIPAWHGEPPTDAYIFLDPPTGKIEIYSKDDITIRGDRNLVIDMKGDISIKAQGDISETAGGSLSLRASAIGLDGPTSARGGISNRDGLVNEGGITNSGGMSNAGGISNSGGTVSSNGIVLDTHTHPGDSGGTMGGPN
jgi:hypothetical protein